MEHDITSRIGDTSEALRDTAIGFEELTDEFHFRLALAGLLRQTAIQLAARGINARAKRPLTAVESLTQVAALLTSTANDLPVLEDVDCACEHGDAEHSLTGCPTQGCGCEHVNGLPDLTRDEAIKIFNKALAVIPGAGAAELDPSLAVRI